MAGRGADGLLTELQAQVRRLEDDLRARAGEVEEFAAVLRAEYDRAREAKRTAAAFGPWLDERVTQSAVAWVLGTVFVRFCEDNGLVEWPFIAGPGERLADAEERHGAFFREHPSRNDRDWIVAAVRHLCDAHPTVAGLFDERHNPMWEITPSFEAAGALLAFWRRRGDDGEVRYDFTGWDTRFLGDLYQDLSEHAKKTYALLQTPVFVEEFILDLTLDPAVEEFGLVGLRTIDPACGSGHFLLGIFHRLLDRWRKAEPGTDDWALIRRSLESVHGCDKNPFAASIARFRLLVAALRAGGVTRLDTAPGFPINVAVGDSLLHGEGVGHQQGELGEPEEAHTYLTEDVNDFIKSCHMLDPSSYHVVVGNPPYITVKDKQENQNYRERYTACTRQYSLAVPFAERMFLLAIRRDGDERDAGFVGQITANSFMKREFGKKLIEEFFPKIHLTHVIDTSGAYIPGHGTPTVILVGRNHYGRIGDPIRAVLGVRGEPSQPDNPAKGQVWSAIVAQVSNPGSESDWISVSDADRRSFSRFPWSLNGGGAPLLLEVLGSRSDKLEGRTSENGRTTHTGLDDAFYMPPATVNTYSLAEFCVPVILGENVRDYVIDASTLSLLPYDSQGDRCDITTSVRHFLWRNRTSLRERVDFGEKPEARGLRWFDHSMFFPRRYRVPLSIAFAFVATHNHFVLDRGGKVFKQSAPVIKLPAEATEDEHLALLGVLNSSTTCFWLKQVCHDKGIRGQGGGFTSDDWEHFYEFTGTKLQEFPLPAELPLDLGRALDLLAQRLARQEPSAVCEGGTPSRERLDVARGEQERIRGRMVTLQEELDWQVYGSYTLLTEAETATLTAPDRDVVPEVALGERAFEIVLARRVAAGEAETVWFTRHGSTPVTEIPAHWPDWYRDIVRARIDTIERRRDLALIERPECKRRWATEPWVKREREALRTWLLDRCERADLWFALRDGMRQPRTLTVNQLADQFRDDAEFTAVAALYTTDHLGKRDVPLAQVLESVLDTEHVPYLAALRYTDTGLRTRAEWEQVWDLQREEDRTGQRLDIPVPPKYGPGDFRKQSYWAARGKLDVPKERFISYPGANPDADPTVLLGWAGWDHRDQAQALVNLTNDRTQQAGWDTDRILPLLTGLAELMPWLHQWHGDYDPDWGGNPAEEYQTYLDDQRTHHQVTEEGLRAWRPAPARRGRKAAATSTGAGEER